MPKFARYGPYVPDTLVQALEDDRVVIFCGAGVSMGAGLPGFQGLVEYCYEQLGVPAPEKNSQEWLWLDRMLGSLESKYSANEVRRVVAERLNRAPTDLELHKAIIRLAKMRHSKGLRLVTTNFDTFFEQAQTELVFGRDLHSAPILPIPRNDRIASWRSIAYLHGRLDDGGGNNDQLILTSADFGRAYLTDAWAARFVTKLFSDFTVLFIGYSLNDPVLRYMTDAFAAEAAISRRSSHSGPAFIFISFQGSPPDTADIELYRARGLEPIFYNQERYHLRLKQTIVEWAKAREDYVLSAQTIIAKAGPSSPKSIDPSDTDNLLWATLGEGTSDGQGARLFANLGVNASIQWIKEFERWEDEKVEQWNSDTRISRQANERLPTKPILPLHSLFPVAGEPLANLPTVSHHIADWLVEHLSSVELVSWIIKKFEANRLLHYAGASTS